MSFSQAKLIPNETEDNVIRGWRRIGIVLSVLVFLPLAIFLWDQPSGD